MTEIPEIDIIIITALRPEFDALKKEFDEFFEHFIPTNKRKTRPLRFYKVQSKNKTFNIALVNQAGMGNINSAAKTSYYIAKFNPLLVIFAGIAGSLKFDELRIGDIIIPSLIQNKQYNKISDAISNVASPEKISFLDGKCNLRWVNYDEEIDPAAHDLINHIDGSEINKNINKFGLPKEWEINKEPYYINREPAYQTEETSFSWDKVISSNEYVSHLNNTSEKMNCAVDMESFGFLKAVNNMQHNWPVSGLVVRSISDYAQFKNVCDKHPQLRKLALCNAAIAVRTIIQSTYADIYLP